MPLNHTPESDDVLHDAEIDAILDELEASIEAGPAEANIKAAAEAEVAELARVLDSL